MHSDIIYISIYMKCIEIAVRQTVVVVTGSGSNSAGGRGSCNGSSSGSVSISGRGLLII